jgi:hypothetical protein
MRIVHVSNFTTKRNGARFYSVEYKLNNGLTRLGHHVFSFSDRDIAGSYLLGLRAAGRSFVNRKLVLVCRELRPDLLLLGHAGLISTDTVRSLRSEFPDMRVAHWSCDSLSFESGNVDLLRAFAPLADATFVTTAGDALKTISSAGGRLAYMPNPVDESIESGRAFESENCTTDLFFAGSSDPERIALCERIRAQLPALKFDVYGMMGNPPIHGAQLVEALGHARMGLAMSRPNDDFLYSSDRMAQLMGNGVLTFVDARARFDTLFAADELVGYADAGDLIAKLQHFMAHDDERRAIAERGWQKAHAHFNATLVAQWIIDATFDLPPSHAYVWPTEVWS